MKYTLITVALLTMFFSFSNAIAGNVGISPGEFISVSNTDVQEIVITCSPSTNNKKAKVGVSWRYKDKKDGNEKETKEDVIIVKCNDKEQQLIAPTINGEKSGGPSITNYGPGFVVVKW